MPEGKFTPKGEDVIREEVINEFKEMGYDPDLEENKPLLDSMVKKGVEVENERLENHKKLSKAIEQKQSWREKATKVLTEDDEDGETKTKVEPQPTDNDKLSKLEQEIEQLKSSQHRQKYPNLSDEEYRSINALAKANEKSFEETIADNPIAKTYFENSEAKERLSGATREPSNRISATQIKTEDEKIADEMDSDLPAGFSSKTN